MGKNFRYDRIQKIEYKMKLKILQENLTKALNIVSRSVAAKSSIPILTNFLITAKKGYLEIYGTDFDISSRILVGADIETEGKICVSAKNFTDLISLLPSGTLEIYSEKENLMVISSRGKTIFATSIADDYPETFIIDKDSKAIMSFNVNIFSQIVDKTTFSTDKQKSKPIFTGIYFDFVANGLNTVATDGFRLSRYLVESNQERLENMSIPSDALDELDKTIKDLGAAGEDIVDVYIANNQAIFKYKNAELAARLIEGIFPDYKAVIPSEFKFNIKVSKADLLQALRISGVFTRNMSVPKVTMTYDFNAKQISFLAEASEIGQNNINIDIEVIEGQDIITSTFNARYIQDALSHVNSDMVVLKGFDNKRIQGATGLTIYENDNNNFVHMIIPFAA